MYLKYNFFIKRNFCYLLKVNSVTFSNLQIKLIRRRLNPQNYSYYKRPVSKVAVVYSESKKRDMQSQGPVEDSSFELCALVKGSCLDCADAS